MVYAQNEGCRFTPETKNELQEAIDEYNGPTDPKGPINQWCVDRIVDMSYLFAFNDFFNEDISEWDVSKVTNMSEMFTYAKSFNQPLAKMNVSSVTNMQSMFSSATAFDQPIGNWNVSSVTDMSYMFFAATYFNQPLDDWNVASVKDMSSVFYRATSFNQPLDHWNVKSVNYMWSMFNQAVSFNQNLCSWGSKLLQGDLSLLFMFTGSGCEYQNDPDLSLSQIVFFCQDCRVFDSLLTGTPTDGTTVVPPIAAPPTTPFVCDAINDPSAESLKLNFACNSGTSSCPSDSDCFDCDPIERNLDCENCIQAGGHYCETKIGRPICSSTEIAKQLPGVCSDYGGTVYHSTCSSFDLQNASTTNTTKDQSSSKLVGLVALAVVPIAILSLLFYRQRQSKTNKNYMAKNKNSGTDCFHQSTQQQITPMNDGINPTSFSSTEHNSDNIQTVLPTFKNQVHSLQQSPPVTEPMNINGNLLPNFKCQADSFESPSPVAGPLHPNTASTQHSLSKNNKSDPSLTGTMNDVPIAEAIPIDTSQLLQRRQSEASC